MHGAGRDTFCCEEIICAAESYFLFRKPEVI